MRWDSKQKVLGLNPDRAMALCFWERHIITHVMLFPTGQFNVSYGDQVGYEEMYLSLAQGDYSSHFELHNMLSRAQGKNK